MERREEPTMIRVNRNRIGRGFTGDRSLLAKTRLLKMRAPEMKWGTRWKFYALLAAGEESGSRFRANAHLIDDETVAKMGHPSFVVV